MDSRQIILVVSLVAAAVFALTNAHVVSLRLLFWEVSIPLILLIFISIVIGFLIGLFRSGYFGHSGKN